jgi:hypothetical protein
LPTLPDRVSDVSEVMWELERQFGLRLSVPDQVSIARELGRRRGDLSASTVAEAFRARGLEVPPRRYADAIVARLGVLRPRWKLIDILLEYRHFAIRELSGQFGGKTTGHEEELRNNLLTFLPERGYTEARTGRGRTDILLPMPTRIIEVKVWESRLKYEDGLAELSRYIETEAAEAAYMVVFGDREPLPPIVPEHTTAIAEERMLVGVVVPVVVVPFEVDQPSRTGATQRRKSRAGR